MGTPLGHVAPGYESSTSSAVCSTLDKVRELQRILFDVLVKT